jgi:hypothetical protein
MYILGIMLNITFMMRRQVKNNRRGIEKVIENKIKHMIYLFFVYFSCFYNIIFKKTTENLFYE